MFKRKNKSKQPKCKNCSLYDSNKGVCRVIILYEGERVNIPVEPNDDCFFIEDFYDKEGKKFQPEIQQVRMWVEDKYGKQTNNDGTVKIEAPKNFFMDK